MARGTQFLALVGMLRRELGRSDDVSVGVSDLPGLKQVLNRTYEALYDDFAWPHLVKVLDKTPLAAGQQLYDLPTGYSYDDVIAIRAWWGNINTTLRRGIGVEDYNAFNSTTGVRSDPPLKWDVRDGGSHEQIEVWPIPASNTVSIQITARTPFVPLTADASVCLLDDQLVVLFAAAEILSDDRPKLAAAKQALAKARYARLKGRASEPSSMVQYGLGGRDSTRERLQVTVRAR